MSSSPAKQGGFSLQTFVQELNDVEEEYGKQISELERLQNMADSGAVEYKVVQTMTKDIYGASVQEDELRRKGKLQRPTLKGMKSQSSQLLLSSSSRMRSVWKQITKTVKEDEDQHGGTHEKDEVSEEKRKIAEVYSPEGIREMPIMEGNLFCYVGPDDGESQVSLSMMHVVLFKHAIVTFGKKDDINTVGARFDLSSESFIGDSHTIEKEASLEEGTGFVLNDFDQTPMHFAANGVDVKGYWMHSIARVIRKHQDESHYFQDVPKFFDKGNKTQEQLEAEFRNRLDAYNKSKGDELKAKKASSNDLVSQGQVDDASSPPTAPIERRTTGSSVNGRESLGNSSSFASRKEGPEGNMTAYTENETQRLNAPLSKSSSSINSNSSNNAERASQSGYDVSGRSSSISKLSRKLSKAFSSDKLSKSGSSEKLSKSGSSGKLSKSGSSGKLSKFGSSGKLSKSGSSGKLSKSGSSGKLSKKSSTSSKLSTKASGTIESPNLNISNSESGLHNLESQNSGSALVGVVQPPPPAVSEPATPPSVDPLLNSGNSLNEDESTTVTSASSTPVKPAKGKQATASKGGTRKPRKVKKKTNGAKVKGGSQKSGSKVASKAGKRRVKKKKKKKTTRSTPIREKNAAEPSIDTFASSASISTATSELTNTTLISDDSDMKSSLQESPAMSMQDMNIDEITAASKEEAAEPLTGEATQTAAGEDGLKGLISKWLDTNSEQPGIGSRLSSLFGAFKSPATTDTPEPVEIGQDMESRTSLQPKSSNVPFKSKGSSANLKSKKSSFLLKSTGSRLSLRSKASSSSLKPKSSSASLGMRQSSAALQPKSSQSTMQNIPSSASLKSKSSTVSLKQKASARNVKSTVQFSAKESSFENQVNAQGSSLKQLTAMWNTKVETEKEPEPVARKPHSSGYGRPPPGSKSEARAAAASQWVDKEINKLLEVLEEMGEHDPEEGGICTIEFGPLFVRYQDVSDTLVGILMRAKKRKHIKYQGDMLFQSYHDHVKITLLQK